MALFKVPIVPQWHHYNCCTTTPDGGFLYIGANTINYIALIKNSDPVIKIFHTRQTITSLDTDPDWSDKKYFAALAQDNSVQIWDFDQCKAVFGHKAHFTTSHLEGNGPSTDKVLLSYMCNRKVLSISSFGDIVTYCVVSNAYHRRTSMILPKHQLTVLKCSPFNENIFAAGTSRGLVIIADLKINQVLYTMSGHSQSVTSLSWTLVEDRSESLKSVTQPEVVEELTPNSIDTKKSNVIVMNVAGGDDIFDIYDYDYLENEFGAPCETNSNQKTTSEFVGLEKAQDENAKFDFVEACQNLKEEIDAIKQDNVVDACENDTAGQVTLKDCQRAEKQSDLSASCGSTEGSVELIEKNSSDDDTNRETQIIHQAEVYAENTEKNAIEKTEAHGIAYAQAASTSVGDILLASSSTDASVWIWNTNTGAACDQLKTRHGNFKNAHLAAIWLKPTVLMTNNRCGEITVWSAIPSNGSKLYKFKETKRKSLQRGVGGVVTFSICTKRQTLWTVSSSREITCEDINKNKIIAKFSCATTNIAGMEECPDDMNKIALAFPDRRIGILDISKSSPTHVTIENFSIHNDDTVHALAWSPNSDFLAFGTKWGKVGIICVDNPKSAPFYFNQICGKPIYSIDWKGKYLYAVCNEKVGLYPGNKTRKDAHILEKITNATALSVHGEFLFVGTQNGHLQVFKRKTNSEMSYELIQELEISPRYITEIRWSPVDTDMFVVASMSNKILAFNFHPEEASVISTVRQFILKNQKAAISWLKWSCRDKDMFMSCGMDGAICIWNLNSETPDEIFVKLFPSPMFCGMFLPTDENIVVCAGKSTSIEMFDMSKEVTDLYLPKSVYKSRVSTLDNVQWGTKFSPLTDGKPTNKNRKNKKNKSTAAQETPMTPNDDTTDEVETTNAVASLLDNLKLADKGKPQTQSNICKSCVPIYLKNPPTLLYLTTKEINKDPLEKIAFILSNKSIRNKMCCTQLFGQKIDAQKLLEEELRNQQLSEARSIANILMPQIKTNLKDEVTKCIQAKQLNEWHVSLAPSVSYNFWKLCSQAYGNQLLEQGNVLQAATYFLGIHKVTETIDILLDKNYFKEALLIGKVHCQSNDPLIDDIINKWISHLDFTGNYASAALLCVLANKHLKASEILKKVRTAMPETEKVIEMLKGYKTANNCKK